MIDIILGRGGNPSNLYVRSGEISFDKSSVFESYADLVTVIIMFKLRERLLLLPSLKILLILVIKF